MPSAKKKQANPKVELYEKAVAAVPGLQRKGAANPYTAINGNMFTLLHQSQTLAIRLPEAARQEFLKKHKSKLFEAYGTVMKEYVTVPDPLLSDTAKLKKYFLISYEYAKTLKPKPTSKKH